MKFIVEGGLPFTLPLLIMFIAGIGLFGIALLKNVQGKESPKKSTEAILFLGSFAFVFGILGQLVGLTMAADVIQKATEISPNIIWGGFKVSLIPTIMGFCILLILSILWFIVKPSK